METGEQVENTAGEGLRLQTAPSPERRCGLIKRRFFNVSTLDKIMRDVLPAEFADEDLPNYIYCGNASPIEPEVLDHLRSADESEMVMFPYQLGGFILFDKIITAHAWSPYTASRKVLMSMAEPVTRTDI